MSDKTIQILSGIAILVRIYIALVFLTAGFPKIVTPHDFALAVATYQILPLPLVNLFSIIVPWMEMLAGFLLLFGIWIKPSSLVIFGLMIMFIVALSIALANGLDIKCGCFASAQAADEIGYKTLFRDLLWLLMALYLMLFDKGRLAVDGLLRREMKNV